MRKKKILIIDDDPVIVKFLASTLQSRNYDVITASDGIIGLEEAKAKRPNLIILDIVMPTMDGYEVCFRLKKDRITKEIPVVMLTSVESKEAVKIAHQAGANDYIIKPIILTTLLTKITKLIKS